jgi:hypothetical protein
MCFVENIKTNIFFLITWFHANLYKSQLISQDFKVNDQTNFY